MDAGALLRQRRLHYGLDQRTLAFRASTSQSHVARIESGEVSPSFATLTRLLAAMGEGLDLASRPLAPNQSAAELREDFERLSPADRVAQAAELSYSLTSIAAARRRT
jgi:transcriptional regulator with XRE-family HTH domain